MTEENLSPSAMPHDVILTEAQKQLRDEILDAVINREAHEAKTLWIAEWSKKTPEEQAELAYAMFCTAAQRDNQMAKRINEGNAEFWKAQNYRRDTERKNKHGGLVRAANSEKTPALKEVRKEWEKWRHKKAYKTAFAMEMIGKYPILESAETIMKKCREWEKECAVESRNQLADSGTS